MQPPASLKALADPIYEAFYGLSDQPFAITTDPKFFYLSTSHQVAFTELLNGLRRREGMLLLTGETGTGKTTLCRTVLESLGQRTFGAMILNPYMSGAEVFRVVLRDFGLVSHEELRRGALASADVSQLLDTLEGFLRSLAALDSHAVVVLDEAQSLAPQVLDQIRVLTALEQDNRRLLQVILCGQPALLDTLKTEPMHALNERITRRVGLKPLAGAEVHAYIQHRIAIAGGAKSVRFDEGATRLVAELSHGLPRRINVLCDRALQEGRVESAAIITPDMVKRGARAIAGAHDPVHVSLPETPAAAPAPAKPAAPRGAAPRPAPPAPPASTQPAAATAPPAPVAAPLTAPAHGKPAAGKPAADAPAEQTGPTASGAFPAESRDHRTLTFGQPEDAPVRKRRGLFAMVFLLIAALGAGAYFWFASEISRGVATPPTQPSPALDRGTPAQPFPVPPQEAPPAAPAAPPNSGQIPDNPDQIN